MTRVVYIVAKGRSGSTLLDHVLGQVGGWTSTGELWRLWDWGLQKHYLCGCGEPIDGCPQWAAVLDHAFGASLDADGSLALRDRVLRWAAAPRLLRGGVPRVEVREYTRLMHRLYEAIGDVTGAEVVVDSSKWPFDPVALGLLPEVDARVIQLVRDPRAVAFSWTRDKRADFQTEPDARMLKFPPVHSALSWTARQAVSELAQRRSPVPWHTVRYEDFAANPRPVLESLLAFAGGGTMPEFTDDHTVVLGGHHMIGGNPSRSAQGPTPIRADEEWQARIPPRAASVVTALTFPLLRRYGYPTRVARPGAGPV